MIRVVTALALLGCVAGAAAQAPDLATPMFEVASVKPAGPPVPIGRLPPDQWRVSRFTLVQILGRAYPQFAFDQLVVGGPAWVREDRFEIDARMPPTTAPAQLAQMIANLLADRFALRTHVEQRPVDVYILRVARDDGRLAAGLTRSDSSCAEARTTNQPLPPQCREDPAAGGFQYRAMRMSDFLRTLSALGIDRPVLDRTDLTGHFDLHMHYDYAPFTGRFASPVTNLNGVSFFTALQEQAGLKLEPAREVIDVLVIDSVEQPSPD